MQHPELTVTQFTMGIMIDDSTLNATRKLSVTRKPFSFVKASGSACEHHLNEQILLAKSDTRGIPAHLPILYFYPWSEKFVLDQTGVSRLPTSVTPCRMEMSRRKIQDIRINTIFL